MKRLLATTALALIIAGPAYAGDGYKATESKSSEATSATIGTEQSAVHIDEFKASNLIGMRVYSAQQEFDENTAVKPNAHEEWQDIGEINDIILTSDGSVEAVIVGVGGVLGIGEKDVALTMEDVSVVPQEGDADDYFLVVRSDLKTLEAMPAYTGPREMQKSESEASDGLTRQERQAQAPAAPSDREQRMAQNEYNAPKDAEKAPQPGQNSMNREGGQASDTPMTTARDTDREMLRRPGISREGYAEAPAEELTAEKLEGAVVYDTNDENIGEINKLVLTEDGSKIQTVVLDIGGFLGIGEHQIGVTMEEIQILRDEDGDFRVYVDASKEQLENQPEYTAAE